MNNIQKIIIFSATIILVLSPVLLQAATFQFDGDGAVIGAIGDQITTADPEEVTTNTMQWILGLLGLISVIVIIFAGFLWMTAAGNEEKISKAKLTLTYAVIGLVVILTSWVLVTFVFDSVNRNL